MPFSMFNFMFVTLYWLLGAPVNFPYSPKSTSHIFDEVSIPCRNPDPIFPLVKKLTRLTVNRARGNNVRGIFVFPKVFSAAKPTGQAEVRLSSS